jgi:hypothetical protein
MARREYRRAPAADGDGEAARGSQLRCRGPHRHLAHGRCGLCRQASSPTSRATPISAGLAGPCRTDRSQGERGRHRHRAPVRAAAASPPLHRICRRQFRSAQDAARDADLHGPARARPRPARRHRLGAAVDRRCLRLPARLRRGVRCARAPDLRVRTGRRGKSRQCGRAQLDLVQCRAADRPGGGGRADRGGRVGPGLPDQRGFLRGRGRVALHDAPRRIPPDRSRHRRARRHRRGLELRRWAGPIWWSRW